MTICSCKSIWQSNSSTGYYVWSNETIYRIGKLLENVERCKPLIKMFFSDSSVANITWKAQTLPEECFFAHSANVVKQVIDIWQCKNISSKLCSFLEYLQDRNYYCCWQIETAKVKTWALNLCLICKEDKLVPSHEQQECLITPSVLYSWIRTPKILSV